MESVLLLQFGIALIYPEFLMMHKKNQKT